MPKKSNTLSKNTGKLDKVAWIQNVAHRRGRFVFLLMLALAWALGPVVPPVSTGAAAVPPEPAAAAAPAPARDGADEPVDGDRLLLGTIGEPSNLIPYISTDASSHEIADMVLVAPLRYSKDLKLEPWAAESYTVSPDGRTFTFTLRKGILWEDGEELTAEDVVYTYRMAGDPSVGSPYGEDFTRMKELRVLDRYRFEVTYESYFARAESTFTSAILPRHILEGQDWRNTTFSRRPIGAGPYRLASWEAGTRLTLAASDTYFMGRPHLDEIIYRIIPDSATMFMEMRAGRLDFMGLSPEQYLKQTDTPQWRERYAKYRYLASAYVYLGFNMEHPFFQDARVRWAISKAISRDELVKGALLGQGVPAFGPYKPGTEFYHPTLRAVERDMDGAARLLAEAGFRDEDGDGVLERDGKPFAFTILTNQGNNERILCAIIIQSQLRKLGIRVQVRTVEWAAFIREFVNKSAFDAVILGWTITPDPDLYQVWHSSAAVPGGLNFTHFRDAELDELLDQGRRTPDRGKRFAIYCRVQELLAREQPYAFLYVAYALPVLHRRFHGIEPALAGITWNIERWWVPRQLQAPEMTR